MKNTIDIVGNTCTACSACIYSCPKGAVKLEVTGMEKVAKVDESLCVDCGVCTKVCHKCSPVEKNKSVIVYAAWATERFSESSSGGIAAAIYKSFLTKGDICFGAAWDNTRVVICSAQNISEAEDFAGSKYVESYLYPALDDIREAIKRDKQVIFIGLPCQVAAVKKLFTSKHLYTADLICHGTPLAEHFSEYMSSIGETIEKARFRGREDFVLRLYNANSECVYNEGQHFDAYFKAFLEGLTYKECCYTCPYACTERVGDITLGDFWGLDKSSLETPPSTNISLLMVNTEKGKEIVEMLQESCVLVPRKLEEAIRENKQLTSPTVNHPERARFVKNLNKYGFVKALYRTKIAKEIKSRNSFFQKVKRKIKLILGR